ncbi:MAG: DUF1127 domain-containing protein, partial [Rhodomicrobium sp.]
DEPDISTSCLYRSSRWGQLKRCFAEWRNSTRSWHELMNLSDRCLHDIGLSRRDAGLEASSAEMAGILASLGST